MGQPKDCEPHLLGSCHHLIWEGAEFENITIGSCLCFMCMFADVPMYFLSFLASTKQIMTSTNILLYVCCWGPKNVSTTGRSSPSVGGAGTMVIIGTEGCVSLALFALSR
jgi:hypothetical protein